MKSGYYKLHYRQGHPAGWTDDLGIIADVNQWVSEELPGWYVYISDWDDYKELKLWCQEHLSSFWTFGPNRWLWIAVEQDATLFTLTWG